MKTNNIFIKALNELSNKPDFVKEIFHECVGAGRFKSISDTYILLTINDENASTLINELQGEGFKVKHIDDINKYKVSWEEE